MVIDVSSAEDHQRRLEHPAEQHGSSAQPPADDQSQVSCQRHEEHDVRSDVQTEQVVVAEQDH